MPTHASELGELPWLALQSYYRTEVMLTHAVTGETHRVGLRPLQRSTDTLEGTARGAARLARWEDRHTQAPALDTLTSTDAGLSGALRRHADDWSALQARST